MVNNKACKKSKCMTKHAKLVMGKWEEWGYISALIIRETGCF